MAKTENLYARIESDLKRPHERLLDMSTLSRKQLHAEFEKGYADIADGRTKPAGEVFASIRKNHNLSLRNSNCQRCVLIVHIRLVYNMSHHLVERRYPIRRWAEFPFGPFFIQWYRPVHSVLTQNADHGAE